MASYAVMNWGCSECMIMMHIEGLYYDLRVAERVAVDLQRRFEKRDHICCLFYVWPVGSEVVSRCPIDTMYNPN